MGEETSCSTRSRQPTPCWMLLRSPPSPSPSTHTTLIGMWAMLMHSGLCVCGRSTFHQLRNCPVAGMWPSYTNRWAGFVRSGWGDVEGPGITGTGSTCVPSISCR